MITKTITVIGCDPEFCPYSKRVKHYDYNDEIKCEHPKRDPYNSVELYEKFGPRPDYEPIGNCGGRGLFPKDCPLNTSTPIIEDGYMLVYIEDYNNKTKLLKEKDAEIARLKTGNNKNAEPCDCPHEHNGCTYSGHCEHRRAPDKDLNGTWLPTCGLKFPENKIVNLKPDKTGDLDDFYKQQSAAARSSNGMA